MIAAAVACVMLGALTLLMAQLMISRARQVAQTAADMASLAAAAHALEGPATACGAARRVATAQGARLLICQLVGPVAQVEAVVRLPGIAGDLTGIRARARAGP